MLRTISISEPVFDLLDREARRSRVSPNALAERLLVERLNAERSPWQEECERLLTRVHARMARFDPAAIENDVTQASSEIKAARRANRRSR